MPAVEMREISIILSWDRVEVPGSVMRVVELEVGETFVGRDGAVADDLDLWDGRDGREVFVQDATLVDGFAVGVDTGRRIEASGELVLSFWSEVVLVFDEDYIVLVEGVAEEGEVVV